MTMLERLKAEISVFFSGPWLPHLLFITISYLIIGRTISYNFYSHFLNGGDTFQWINFQMFLFKSLYIWEASATGFLSPMIFWTTPYNSILVLLEYFGGSQILAINLLWILLLYLTQLSFYCFYKIYLNKRDSILATFASIFNIFFLLLFHTPVHHLVVAYFAFPLMYFLFHSYINSSKFKYAAIYIVFQLVLFRTLNIMIMLNIAVPFIYSLIHIRNSSYAEMTNFIKKTTILWICGMFVTAHLIINTLLFLIYPQANTQMKEYNESALTIYNIDNLANLFRLTNNYGFLNMNGEEYPGLQGKDYSPFYLKNAGAVAISYVLFALLLVAIFNNKRSNNKLFLLPIVIITLFFLAKGLNEPIPKINEFLLSNSIYLTFFRSGAKYFILVFLPIVILYIVYILRGSKVKYLLLPYISLHVFLIFLYSTPTHHSWDSMIPSSLVDISSTLNSIQDARVLVLPITEHFAGYTDYSDGYSGPERLYSLTNTRLLTKIHSPIISDTYSISLEKIRTDYTRINTEYERLGYDHLLVERNTVPSTYHPIETYQQVESIIDRSIWQLVYENTDYKLYSLVKSLEPAILKSLSGHLKYTKISPVEYNVEITNMEEQTVVSLLETFNAGWDIFPIKKQQVNEAGHWFSLRYLTQKDIASESHVQAFGYANAWTIKASQFVEQFDKSYYEQNSDGTMNVNFVIYYSPQMYYIVGMIISALTLFFVVVFTIIKEWGLYITHMWKKL